MASKRAIQLLPLRTSSTVLRAQCTSAPRQCFSRVPAVRNGIISISRPQFVSRHEQQQQRRWNTSSSKPESEAQSQPQPQETKKYDFEDVQALTQSPTANSPLLIDVREPHEFSAGTIPTSINIPISSSPDAFFLPAEEFEERFGFEKPELDREVVMFCKAGVRSRAAAVLAGRAGYKGVGEYGGSWVDWGRRGGGVEVP